MKNARQIVLGATLFGALAVALPGGALAATYTPACTEINNTAHVAYTVNNIPQGPSGNGLNSTTATFYVGVKVNLAVATTDTADVTVYPGSAGSALHFTVTNNGNATQQYALSYLAKGNGTPNPFTGNADGYDASNVKIFVNGTETSTIASLAPDASQTVTVVADTSLSQKDAEVAVYALKAQTQWVGAAAGSYVNSENNVLGSVIGGAVCGAAIQSGKNIEVVLADPAGTAGDGDAARDGAASSRSAYQVTAANLTIDKSSQVVWDPINCVTPYAYGATCNALPKAIPGAVVEYTVSINNNASGQASNVTVTDSIDNNLTFYQDGYASGKGMQFTSANNTVTALTNGADADNGLFTSPKTVTVNNLTVSNGDTVYVKFRASIN